MRIRGHSCSEETHLLLLFLLLLHSAMANSISDRALCCPPAGHIDGDESGDYPKAQKEDMVGLGGARALGGATVRNPEVVKRGSQHGRESTVGEGEGGRGGGGEGRRSHSFREGIAIFYKHGHSVARSIRQVQ